MSQTDEYWPDADVVETLTIGAPPAEKPEDALRAHSLRFYGPDCNACTKHDKVGVISYQLGHSSAIKDAFITSNLAFDLRKQVVSAVKQGADLRKGILLQLCTVLDRENILLFAGPSQAGDFMTDFKLRETEMLKAAQFRLMRGMVETTPVRREARRTLRR